MCAHHAMDIPLGVIFPLIGVGGVLLLLSGLFCLYLWKLRRDGRRTIGYKTVVVKSKKSNGKNSNDTCPVCLDEFKIKEKIAVCPCQHGFHIKCIIQWLEHKKICPMCKARVGCGPSERSGLVTPPRPVNYAFL